VLEQGELFLAYVNASSRFVLLFFGHFKKVTDTKIDGVGITLSIALLPYGLPITQ
jgi:hypothetical protein